MNIGVFCGYMTQVAQIVVFVLVLFVSGVSLCSFGFAVMLVWLFGLDFVRDLGFELFSEVIELSDLAITSKTVH
jgi:hypothetical protein